MAGELWNRVNIPFPSVVSSVRVPFSTTTDANVKTLLVENEKVLKLIRSEILETEIRVLYELLHILNNSFRGNKTFKGLKQVEQCINRLKSMKLDVALQELTELCPNRIKRGLSIKIGEGDVPSQPFLEWLCLKVLGGAQLMSCTLDRCSRAFIFMPPIRGEIMSDTVVGTNIVPDYLSKSGLLPEYFLSRTSLANKRDILGQLTVLPNENVSLRLSKQQMKWEEFVILNVVITSMLSRLWVIFRGILVSLSALYQRLLELLREVASAQPIPFLTDFSLPADMTQFLCPSEAFVLTKPSAHLPRGREKEKRQRGNETRHVKVKNQGQTKKVKEDFGVAVERGRVLDTDLKPFLSVFRKFTKGKRLPQETHWTDKKQVFKKQVKAAMTVADMMTRLKEMIGWCKSQKMKKEKCLLTSLCLKCQRLKCLEAAGYNVQRKLQTFRQKAVWALSPQGSVPRTRRSSAAMRSKAHQRNRFHSLRSRSKSSAVRAGIKKKQRRRQRKRTDVSVSPLSGDDQRHRTTHTMTSQTTGNDSHDDIDDIFASVGF